MRPVKLDRFPGLRIDDAYTADFPRLRIEDQAEYDTERT